MPQNNDRKENDHPSKRIFQNVFICLTPNFHKIQTDFEIHSDIFQRYEEIRVLYAHAKSCKELKSSKSTEQPEETVPFTSPT